MHISGLFWGCIRIMEKKMETTIVYIYTYVYIYIEGYIRMEVGVLQGPGCIISEALKSLRGDFALSQHN